MKSNDPALHLVGSNGATEKLDQYARVKPELPPRPAGLKKVAGRVWEELGPQLVSAGLITVVDGQAFMLLCNNIADFETVQGKLESIDDWVTKTPNDFVVHSVWWNIRNRLHDDILKMCKEFGMTPASRSGLKAAPGATNQQDLFGGVSSPDAPISPYAAYPSRHS